jgi:hypothetical protein
LRFRLREALRPLELPRLLSLGALVEESLSTRLDSVRAPDLLWVSRERLDPERLDPDPRLRELAFERPFDEEERPPDFEEEPLEPPERLLLLLDEDLRWGILPFIPPESFVNPCGGITRSQPFKHSTWAAIQISPLRTQFKFQISG